MLNLDFILSLGEIDFIIQVIERATTILMIYYTYVKIVNIKDIKIINKILLFISCPVISIISLKVKYSLDSFCSILLLLIFVGIINRISLKKELPYTMIITIISLGINYAMHAIATLISFIPFAIFKIQNDYINLIIILCIYVLMILGLLRFKKMKYGIAFLQKNLSDSNLSILIFNIGIMLLLCNIVLRIVPYTEARKTGVVLTILSVYMIITIVHSFKLYYKQKQLIKELEETKKELEDKNKEIKKLEKENLEFSKTSHSLAHKQRALEYKINQLTINNNENEKEQLKEELAEISKELYKEPRDTELKKTEIPSIDNMLSYMQSECNKNNIKFELQVEGNIHYMVNHLITEEELEIMIADHIKDAIIAIKSGDNKNRSIMVRIGKIEDIYSLYIYDSGIEFTKEVLDKLGKEPITTHKDEGGTGMGFMNTFDVLKKYKASLIIDEISRPSIDNYTKAIIVKFDNNEDFEIKSNIGSNV